MFNGTCTQMLHIPSAMLYQVRYRASLLCQKSHTYEFGYVMQMSNCINLQIMLYSIVFWGFYIVLCKELRKNMFFNW